MFIFDAHLEEEYREKDIVLNLLNSVAQQADSEFTSHRWLLESLPKRMIYYHMYGDLLESESRRKRVLDVGGGYTAISRALVQNHDYFTLDIMAHDNHELLRDVQESIGKEFWINADWYEFDASGGYDLVIANDLFPNVDQRLLLFLDKFLPICGEMRVSLTYYNTPRWYKVKRTDGDEVFHMMAWDGVQVVRVLEKYVERIQEPRLDLLLKNPASLFANNRQVGMVTFEAGRCRS